MRALAVLMLAFLPACGWGPAVFDCDDAKAAAGMREAVERWPDVDEVVGRLDVFCVDRFEINSFGYCGRAKASDVDACLMWIGSPMGRARMYVASDTPVDAAIVHEMQHAHLWEQPGACDTHQPSCGWEEL